ncbi:MAG: DEAD/DEAH box helicase, partial [Methylocystaceae bacterium]|nr:DEAD/DEAH box helicase [Methylocystaceae bacterium]
EADRMLDMGFIRDIQKIVDRLPKNRHTVFLSATMPQSVVKLANSMLRNPVRIDIAPASSTVDKIDQHVLMVPKNRKRDLLAHVLKDEAIKRVLVFTRTKHGANRVSKYLEQLGIRSNAIHGNKSQNARQKALKEFKSGEIRALVATDVAARGIDVDDVTHVINFELPNEPESYVHRIGRTARAGATGVSLSFCDHEERGFLRDIEKTIRKQVPMMEDHPFHMEGIDLQFEAPTERTKPGGQPKAQKRRPNSGKHKPNRRINQPKSHAGNTTPAGGATRKAKPAAKRGRSR